MAVIETLALVGGWALGGLVEGATDRVFLKAVSETRLALLAGAEEPRNHDVLRAIFRAHLLSLRLAAKAYERLPHDTWKAFPGYSPEDLTTPMEVSIRRSLMAKELPDPRDNVSLSSDVETLLVHPPPHDGSALERAAKVRQTLEAWALREAKARVGEIPDWDRFEAILRKGTGPGGYPGWWPMLRAFLAEEIKEDERVFRILTTQGVGRLLSDTDDLRTTARRLETGVDVLSFEVRDALATLRLVEQRLKGSKDHLEVAVASLDAAIDASADRFSRIDASLTALSSSVDALLDRTVATSSGSQATEDADDAAILRAYLAGVMRSSEWLELPGDPSRSRRAKLDGVYVALRGDLAVSAAERASAYIEFEIAFHRWVRDQNAALATNANPADLRDHFIAKHRRLMPQLARAPSSLHAGSLRVNLAEAVRDCSQLVLLGGPGSGKTTLSRWLAAAHARGWLADDHTPGELFVPRRSVDPEAGGSDDDRPISLGKTRVPVLVRVSEYARHLKESGSGLSLVDFLGRHHWQAAGESEQDLPDRVRLNGALRRLLAEGRLLVILDGLDEVPDPSLRRAVLEEVRAFCARWTAPGDAGGDNQLLVTSRPVGYDAERLPDDWSHVVVEPMRPTTVLRFWERLLSAMGSDQEAAQHRGAAELLHQQVFSTHAFGIASLCTVPLLATLVAVMFDKAGRSSLPSRRVDVYEAALKLLVEDWRPVEGLTAASWSDVLAPIALHMHEAGDEALIPRSDLVQALGERLAEVDPTLSSTVARRRAVERFLEDVDRRVGLMVARRPNVYGFIHRTFQEYLVARWLVDESTQAASRLAPRLSRPHWREAVKLAFERIGSEDSEWTVLDRSRLIAELLEAPQTTNRLWLVEQLLDLCAGEASAPGDDGIKALVRALVGLVGTGGLSVGAAAGRLAILVVQSPSAAERELCSLLTGPDEYLVHAVVKILVAERWFSPALVSALETAERFDGPENLWSAGKALRIAASGPTGGEDPEPLARSDFDGDAADLRLEPTALATLIPGARRRTLARQAARRTLSLTRPYRRDPTDVRGLTSPAAVRHLLQHRGWRIAVIALLGGLDDRDAEGADRRLADVRTSVTSRRTPAMANDLVEAFGARDPVGRASAWLNRREGTAEPVRFDPNLITSVRTLPAAFSRLLAQGAPRERLVECANQPLPEDEAPALVLGAIAADTTFDLDRRQVVDRLNPAQQTNLRRLAREGLSRLADPAYRSFRTFRSTGSGPGSHALAIANLYALDRAYGGWTQDASGHDTGQRSAGEHFGIDPGRESTRAVTEILEQVTRQQASVAVARVPEIQAATLGYAPTTRPQLPMVASRGRALPASTVDALASLALGQRRRLLDTLAPVDRSRPGDRLPEDQLNLAIHYRLAPAANDGNVSRWAAQAAGDLEWVADSFLRGRIALELTALDPGLADLLLPIARECARSAPSPLHRLTLLDGLAEHAQDVDLAIEQALLILPTVEDPSARWRFAARLLPLSGDTQSPRLVARIVEALLATRPEHREGDLTVVGLVASRQRVLAQALTAAGLQAEAPIGEPSTAADPKVGTLLDVLAAIRACTDVLAVLPEEEAPPSSRPGAASHGPSFSHEIEDLVGLAETAPGEVHDQLAASPMTWREAVALAPALLASPHADLQIEGAIAATEAGLYRDGQVVRALLRGLASPIDSVRLRSACAISSGNTSSNRGARPWSAKALGEDLLRAAAKAREGQAVGWSVEAFFADVVHDDGALIDRLCDGVEQDDMVATRILRLLAAADHHVVRRLQQRYQLGSVKLRGVLIDLLATMSACAIAEQRDSASWIDQWLTRDMIDPENDRRWLREGAKSFVGALELVLGMQGMGTASQIEKVEESLLSRRSNLRTAIQQRGPTVALAAYHGSQVARLDPLAAPKGEAFVDTAVGERVDAVSRLTAAWLNAPEFGPADSDVRGYLLHVAARTAERAPSLFWNEMARFGDPRDLTEILSRRAQGDSAYALASTVRLVATAPEVDAHSISVLLAVARLPEEEVWQRCFDALFCIERVSKEGLETLLTAMDDSPRVVAFAARILSRIAYGYRTPGRERDRIFDRLARLVDARGSERVWRLDSQYLNRRVDAQSASLAAVLNDEQNAADLLAAQRREASHFG